MLENFVCLESCEKGGQLLFFLNGNEIQYHYKPLILQPKSNALELHRFYITLKWDRNYKRRVSWLGFRDGINISKTWVVRVVLGRA